ncbi:multiple sugar transport system substrate-binding protein [Kaistia soli DSM 19436]|uniref:Multiple sugar transport system substrate-binding protein n=1 Tax=Kaistia soli DSM 19436 TaxID=1122133 RepID=A0A1M5C3U5_9HYPH|nr:extracellular solute-binding protein [Kaistia soli]SHF49409.1 multiple sugar transport system substrate-binding protein [Kaistia soli DSM 19436]
MSLKRLVRAAAFFTATALTASLGLAAGASAAAIGDAPATGALQIWIGGAEGDKLPAFLADFEKANPDLKVQITQIPSEQFDAKLLTAIAAGTVPDIVRLYSQSQASLMATDAFAPVPEGLVKADDFFASAYETNVRDGVAYGVPWDAYATMFQYRKDLAEKAGLSAPKTWEELKTFAKAMKDQGATWGFSADVGYDIYNAQGLNEFAYQAGGGFLSADRKQWTINSEANIKALEFWGSLFTEGLASPDGPKFLDTVPWFTSGEIASKDIGPWFEGWLVQANGQDWVTAKLATAPMPAGPAGSFSALGSGSLAVLKDGKNPDAAWKLVRYLTQPDTQLAWYKAFGSLPAVKAAWNDPAIAGNPLLDAERQALQTAVDIPQVTTWNQVGTYMGQQMELVARGQATAKQVLDDVQAFAESAGLGK